MTTAAGGSQVQNVVIHELCIGVLSARSTFDRVVRSPLEALFASGFDRPVVLLVDALDEALTYSGGTNIVQLLAKLTDLPPKVRILATTHSDPTVLKLFREARRFDLIVDAPPSVNDVERYVMEQLAVQDGLDPTQGAQLARRLSGAADGIFLYAHMVLDDLLSRLPQLPDLETYPLARRPEWPLPRLPQPRAGQG